MERKSIRTTLVLMIAAIVIHTSGAMSNFGDNVTIPGNYTSQAQAGAEQVPAYFDTNGLLFRNNNVPIKLNAPLSGNCLSGQHYVANGDGNNTCTNLPPSGSTITYFLRNESTTDTSYTSKQMKQTFNITTPLASITTLNIANGNTLLMNWTSPEMNLTFIPAGVHELHIHAAKLSSNTHTDKLYYVCGYVNSTGGNLTIVGTSELDMAVEIPSGNITTEFDLDMLMNDTHVNSTDRMYVGVYVNQIGVGAVPDIRLEFDDLTDSRLIFPATQTDLTPILENISKLQNEKLNKSGDNWNGAYTNISGSITTYLNPVGQMYLSATDGTDTGIIGIHAGNAYLQAGNGVQSDITVSPYGVSITAESEHYSFTSTALDVVGKNIINCANCITQTDFTPVLNDISTLQAEVIQLQNNDSEYRKYVLPFETANGNPANATRYRFASRGNSWLTTTNSSSGLLRIPYDSNLTGIYAELNCGASGAGGSNMTLYLQDSPLTFTDYVGENVVNGAARHEFSNYSMNRVFTRGTYLNFEFTTTTWTALPTTCSWDGYLELERP